MKVMEKKFDIITVGTALVDSIIKGFDPEPISASGYRAESCSLHAGGEAVNEAVAAAKLGMRAGSLCFLGDDTAGKLISNTLSGYGVDTGLIVREKDHPTPVTTMFVREDGSRKSITNTSHRYNFHPECYLERIGQTRAIILGSLFRAPFDDPGIVHLLLRFAKEHGILAVADTKLPNFRKLTLGDLKESLPFVDCITPNEDEARYYTEKEDPARMAEVFLNYGIKSVIIKLGSKGCYYRDAQKELSLPAMKIKAVDATGAGDNFVAGFVSELLRGKCPEEALLFANACGAICTTEAGACTALKDREQVLKMIQTAN